MPSGSHGLNGRLARLSNLRDTSDQKPDFDSSRQRKWAFLERLIRQKRFSVIDHVDTEYCFRAACHGVPVRINPALTLKHEISTRIERKLLFLTLVQWNMIPLRQYYSARNCIHIFRRYGAQFPPLALINIITLQQIVSVTLFEQEKCRKLLAMIAGIVDGLRSRYGSFESCWPWISTVCVRPGQ